MKLKSFSIKNYRSIVKAENLPLRDLTILVGPNNEGKSNILKALVTALTIVTEAEARRSTRYSRYDLHSLNNFQWDRDFPVHLQDKREKGTCTFILEFELSPEEREKFKQVVGNTISGNLKLKLEIGEKLESYAKFEVIIQGPGKQSLSSKRLQIAAFVKDHLEFVYIPAIRTVENTNRVIERMLSRSFLALEDPEYEKLLEQIEHLRKPVLERVGESLKESLKAILPVKGVRIEMGKSSIRSAPPRFRVLVDDGAETDLGLKGDGIISLATIALVRQSSLREIASIKSLIRSRPEVGGN